MQPHILILVLGIVVSQDISELPSADGVELVFVGFRHGDRFPVDLLPDDPNKGKWGFEGEAQLSEIGKKQAFGLGELCRTRYGKLIGEHFFPSNTTKAMTSPADRCQMTTGSMLAGLYPPKSWAIWDKGLAWQPISVGQSVPLLRMYNLDGCKTQAAAWAAVYSASTTGGMEVVANNTELVNFLANKTGWAPTLSKMGDLADNLHGIKIRNLTMPDWVTNNPFNRDISDEIIAKFQDIPQRLCAAYTPCRWMMAGYWLNDILTNLQNFKNGTQKRKMYVYGSHNEIVTSLFWIMGVKLDGVAYNGANILEVRSKPSLQVRLIYSTPLESDPEKRISTVQKMKFCDGNEWCDYETFYKGVKPFIISDYKQACDYPTCFCGPSRVPVTVPNV